MASRRFIEIRGALFIFILLANAANVTATFMSAPGYTSTELYSTTGTYTTIGGLDLDGGRLYFGQYTDIKSLDLGDNSTQVAGTIPDNVGNALVVRHNGTTYTSYGISYNSPYPYKMGYINSSGNYINQLNEDGIYDCALNSLDDCYIVASPDALGSKIFKYEWSNGSTADVADIGGYSGGLAFDSFDNLYYAEQTNGQILKFTAAEVAAGGLDVSDADVALSITAGYICFGADNNLYATTGWGATLAKYDLSTQSLVSEIAYGGIGKFTVDGDSIYLADTDWVDYSSTIQHVVPEPTTVVLLGLGGLLLVRRKS